MDDALVFTGHGQVTLRDLLARPTRLRVAAAGDAFKQLVGYRFEPGEFVAAGFAFHCGGGNG